MDLSNKALHIENSPTLRTKTRKRRIVPLNEDAYRILLSRKLLSDNEYVFSNKGQLLDANFITHKLKKYVRLLGLDDRLNLHSLRHTFATWLVQEGAPVYEVQKLLGHSNISVTQVYTHLQPEKLHSTVNRISILLN